MTPRFIQWFRAYRRDIQRDFPLLSTGKDFPDFPSRCALLNPTRSNATCETTSRSPSPQPSPLGRGRHVIPLAEQRGVADWRKNGKRFSLSPRERDGVRGKE